MAGDDFEKETGGGSKKSKDFWLVLIFVDIVLLVFFGFLIYQRLSEKFTARPTVKHNIPIVQNPVNETPAPPPVQEIPTLTQIPPEETLPPTPEPQPVVEPAPAPEPPQPVVEKRQSVFIAPTAGKTSKVTFKYFGDAKSVSLVSGFTMAQPQALKKVGGVWQREFVIYPGEYKYLFIVDGVKTLDPNTEENGGRSVVKIP